MTNTYTISYMYTMQIVSKKNFQNKYMYMYISVSMDTTCIYSIFKKLMYMY